MFTPAMDYNQQLLAYLQAARQLLEQWTTMSAGLPFPTAPFMMPSPPQGGPFMPPTAPYMPGMPTMPAMPTMPMPTMPSTASAPPAPGDYSQQLFAYLQAWRQYLEQMTGAAPGSPQVPPGQPASAPQSANAAGSQPAAGSQLAAGAGITGGPASPQAAPTASGGGTSTVEGVVHQQSVPNWPPLFDVAPTTETGSQISGPRVPPGVPLGQGVDEPQVLNAPGDDAGYQFNVPHPDALFHTWGPRTEPSTGSAFESLAERVEPIVSPAAAPESLFRTVAEKPSV